jgi:hypothetical protein
VRSQRPDRLVPGLIPPIEMTVRSAELCGSPELLEPDRQPVAIGTILKPSRPVDQCSGDPLKAEFKKRAVMYFQEPIRHMDAEIGVDPDQVGIEGRVMELRQR